MRSSGGAEGIHNKKINQKQSSHIEAKNNTRQFLCGTIVAGVSVAVTTLLLPGIEGIAVSAAGMGIAALVNIDEETELAREIEKMKNAAGNAEKVNKNILNIRDTISLLRGELRLPRSVEQVSSMKSTEPATKQMAPLGSTARYNE
ncbi:hypothetical protein BC938DRAFT_482135 [Jimgerdemannia flammicorona]|uniref:Uncharacterized protein n=1 Tax=Jimgerdemannia flammicorona TaxID=994334 RepID=A0A433QEM0_9FUNG|nr:hypothetical protein BC938DRAFT_482135 [Jimgerdemannia flammicorona]